MKFVKSISLFFVIPVLLIMLGFLLGNKFSNFFYPGDNPVKLEKQRVQKEQKEQPDAGRYEEFRKIIERRKANGQDDI